MPQAPEIRALYEGLDALYSRLGTDQTTLSLGARWDLHENMALKVQWDHVTTKGYDLWGIEESISPDSKYDLNLLSVSLSWIF